MVNALYCYTTLYLGWHAASQIKNKINNVIYLPSVAFKVKIQHDNYVENPNWLKENQSAIYKRDQGLELKALNSSWGLLRNKSM